MLTQSKFCWNRLGRILLIFGCSQVNRIRPRPTRPNFSQDQLEWVLIVVIKTNFWPRPTQPNFSWDRLNWVLVVVALTEVDSVKFWLGFTQSNLAKLRLESTRPNFDLGGLDQIQPIFCHGRFSRFLMSANSVEFVQA